MIDFLVHPFLENPIKGCHGNHAFSHSPNRFNFEKHFYAFRGTGNNLSPMRNCPGVQGRSN